MASGKLRDVRAKCRVIFVEGKKLCRDETASLLSTRPSNSHGDAFGDSCLNAWIRKHLRWHQSATFAGGHDKAPRPNRKRRKA